MHEPFLPHIHLEPVRFSPLPVSPKHSLPHYDELRSVTALQDSQVVADDLKKIPWGFKDDTTGFLTHDLHPYPAKFIPQIPGHAIARLTFRGEVVLDPFGGSGTTALEAVRLGRRAISVDANPVATLIGKVKTCNLDGQALTDLNAIRCALTTGLLALPPGEFLCSEYSRQIPTITNMDKWFPITSRGELAFIKEHISRLESDKAKTVCLLALSKIILAVSFQDSETRYSSKPRTIPPGETTKRFLLALDHVHRSIIATQPLMRYGVAEFFTADARSLPEQVCPDNFIDLIVTSPPYGNANDYHLYHRFRLLWLGYDPLTLAKIEIGSHLRHQKESSGFDSYVSEMHQSLIHMYRVLKNGRYVVLIVGDAIYGNTLHPAAEALSKAAGQIGFESVTIIERQIHPSKRSFVAAARRATSEKLLILRKPATKQKVWFFPPPYKLWDYECELRTREISSVVGITGAKTNTAGILQGEIDSYSISQARRLAFTHGFSRSGQPLAEFTWQAILENGLASKPSVRKDPKYVTHGLHEYKGKFYPQLAKALVNISDLKTGENVLDPFCGSGTTLLEGYLNGYSSYGFDINPLAAKIARAKVGICEVDPDLVSETARTLLSRVEQTPTDFSAPYTEFNQDCVGEIERWFPLPVVKKLNWLLKAIRATSEGILRDYFEVILSSILREVSHQEPTDLRIRKRKRLLKDANVIGLFADALRLQFGRLERFWSVRGYCCADFQAAKVIEGDARDWQTFGFLGITPGSIDLILTSPPYATALPYIDTDRLSLLVLTDVSGSRRRPLERILVGSREITTNDKKHFMDKLGDNTLLPSGVSKYLQDFTARVSAAKVGFRRENMPALLMRFFLDMKTVLEHCYRSLRSGGEAMIVIGDNRTRLNRNYERIATTEFLAEIASDIGFKLKERINISVTTENLVHIKNAITSNVVLRLTKK